MKKEKILKIMLVLLMGIILMAMSINVYAAPEDDFGLDIIPGTTNNGGAIDLTPTIDNTNTNNMNTNTNTDLTNTNTNSANTNNNVNTNNYNTNLPEAGVAENTVIGIALTVLTIVAIYAFNKVKYYKNI